MLLVTKQNHLHYVTIHSISYSVQNHNSTLSLLINYDKSQLYPKLRSATSPSSSFTQISINIYHKNSHRQSRINGLLQESTQGGGFQAPIPSVSQPHKGVAQKGLTWDRS